jgi:hypothetical protein
VALQEVEADFHCIRSIHEAVSVERNIHLSRLFNPDILGRLPTTGIERVRRTALTVIGMFSDFSAATIADRIPLGEYASWFTTQSVPDLAGAPDLLMTSVSFVVGSLPEPLLCLQAANALRSLCDANRSFLAPHIDAFAQVHANLTGIPVSVSFAGLQIALKW